MRTPKISPNFVVGSVARIKGAIVEIRNRDSFVLIATVEEREYLKQAQSLVDKVFVSMARRYYKNCKKSLS